MAPLETELQTYDENKRSLLATAPGKFALIHDGDVVGTYDTRNDAISAGYDKFGNTAFLVKEITEIDPPQTFISNVLIKR